MSEQKSNIIYQCENCGERKRNSARFCQACSTAAGRAKIKAENDKIWADNEKIGFINPNSHPIYTRKKELVSMNYA